MDPYSCSRVRDEDTSYRNDMRSKTRGHLLQIAFTNDTGKNSIRDAIAAYEDLLTTGNIRKLRCCGHNKINMTYKDDPTGFGIRREKKRQTAEEMGGQNIGIISVSFG